MNQTTTFLKKIHDPNEIHKRQIPEGYELHEMEGACPGSSGEVKIEYYPSNKPDDVKIIDWKPNEVSKDYTIQWRIKNLKPDTNYTVNLYARKNKSKNRNSDFLSANFKTPPSINIQKDMIESGKAFEWPVMNCQSLHCHCFHSSRMEYCAEPLRGG